MNKSMKHDNINKVQRKENKKYSHIIKVHQEKKYET